MVIENLSIGEEFAAEIWSMDLSRL